MKTIATIEIENMEFFARHGCFAEERIIGNSFLASLTMQVDVSKASVSDNITDAVSYQDAYNLVKAEVLKPSNLLENVAKRVLDSIFKNLEGVLFATIKISKLNPPMGGLIEKASVCISREK